MFTYKITGKITWNEAETEEGYETIEIDEKVQVEEKSASEAFAQFLKENEQYEFYGSLKSCDAKTGGKIGATFRDKNEGQTIDVDLV
jgi:hypothetical protein